jgi:hypothetical protein
MPGTRGRPCFQGKPKGKQLAKLVDYRTELKLFPHLGPTLATSVFFAF